MPLLFLTYPNAFVIVVSKSCAFIIVFCIITPLLFLTCPNALVIITVLKSYAFIAFKRDCAFTNTKIPVIIIVLYGCAFVVSYCSLDGANSALIHSDIVVLKKQ